MGATSSQEDIRYRDIHEESCCVLDINNLVMGNSTSSSKKIREKVEFSKKTGVLNLSDVHVSPTSSIWSILTNKDIIGKLKSLDISNCSLPSMPAEIQLLVNLKTLHASKCVMTRTLDLSSCTLLTTLNIRDNNLEVDSLRLLPPSLTKLDLSHNSFSGFPSIIVNLVQLVELDLSSNRIDCTVGIGMLISLVELTLDDNTILELSEDIKDLKKLKKLSLKRNRLHRTAVSGPWQSIPASIFLETSIEHMDLQGNPLTKKEIMDFDGIREFIERRKKVKDKHLQGGGFLDFSIFGLD